MGRDALAELASWLEIMIEWIPDVDVGEGCSVAGPSVTIGSSFDSQCPLVLSHLSHPADRLGRRRQVTWAVHQTGKRWPPIFRAGGEE